MRIAVAGALAQRPGRGGHAWVFLQYLLGFRRLGCDVLFIDRLEAGMCRDRAGRPCRPESSVNIEYLRRVMGEFGLGGATAVLVEDGRESLGLERQDLQRRMKAVDLLVDVMGYLDCEDLREAAACRVFLDIDPGFVQMWWAHGLHDPFGHHDAYATVGSNIGQPGCSIPTCGVDWITTKPPVVLQYWPVVAPNGDRITSVATWRGPFAPIEHKGVEYGLRAHQLRPLAGLPLHSRHEFELALEIDASDQADITMLLANGWRLVDPHVVADTPRSYQRYVQGSAAELMVPKGMYARSTSGWFSDRSACYLATGRPVVAQDTGLARLYPLDAGLLTFASLDDAVSRLAELWDDYANHAHAARQLAEEYFASDRVLTQLLEDVGLS